MNSSKTGAQPALKVLEVSASGRHGDSVSRGLTQNIIDALETRYGAIDLIRRDLSDGVPFVSDEWIAANFTPDEERTARHDNALAESGALVQELRQADVIVIGAPIYNFGVPAVLKAWIDMIARARLTFRYTSDGPEGLLGGKKAYVVVASGGVPVGSPYDFLTPYLRHVLGFIGISDVEIIAADQLNKATEDTIDAARARIADLIHTGQALSDRVA